MLAMLCYATLRYDANFAALRHATLAMLHATT